MTNMDIWKPHAENNTLPVKPESEPTNEPDDQIHLAVTTPRF